MSSTSEAKISCLPDESLAEVLSNITRIPNKMLLEQVSKRFRHVSAKSQSWKGIHSLQLVMKCGTESEWDMQGYTEIKSHCKNQILLNNCSIPSAKWPAAVQLLVDRAQIRHLILHSGHSLIASSEGRTVLSHLIEVLKGSDEKKVKLESLEFHCSKIGDPSSDCSFRSFLLDSLQLSIPYLKAFLLKVDYNKHLNEALDGPLAPIWPILKECKYLESFSCTANLFVDLSVIVGKPLRKLVLESGAFNFGILDHLVQALNSASGVGTEELTIVDPHMPSGTDLKEFCDRLSEDARKKLRIIRSNHIFNDYDVFTQLPLIPSMLPKLERLETKFAEYDRDYDMNELFNNFVSFLTLTHGDSFPRQILIHFLVVYDVEAFKTGLTNACQAADINADIGEKEVVEADWQFPLDLPGEVSLSKGDKEQTVLLTKGNSSIRIIETHEESHSEDGSNFDDFNDQLSLDDDESDDNDDDD